MPIAFSDPKDPDDIDDFTVDFAAWLAVGETIAAKEVSAITSGVTVDSSTINGTKVTARIRGGTANTNYDIRWRITTSAGRQLDETGRIVVRDR